MEMKTREDPEIVCEELDQKREELAFQKAAGERVFSRENLVRAKGKGKLQKME